MLCGALLVLLVITIPSTYFYFQSQVSALENEKHLLLNQIDHLQIQLETLNGTSQEYIPLDEHQEYINTHKYSNTEYETLKIEYEKYTSSHNYLDSEYDFLLATYNSYLNTHNYNDSQYNSIAEKMMLLEAPKLSILNVKTLNVEACCNTSYLQVYGEVWNVGNETAYNCSLKINGFLNNILVLDIVIELGSIPAENKVEVTDIKYYLGTLLDSTQITPKWNTE